MTPELVFLTICAAGIAFMVVTSIGFFIADNAAGLIPLALAALLFFCALNIPISPESQLTDAQREQNRITHLEQTATTCINRGGTPVAAYRDLICAVPGTPTR